MANAPRAPKQWCLTKVETVNSFENWKQNLVYTLSLDPNFAPFLTDTSRWEKKTKSAPLRGFTNDPDGTTGGRTAQQKVNMLELMLGQIANFCPIISRNTIVKNSTCISDLWQSIRLHYGFQSTGGHFIDFAEIKLEADERPEDLYQRLMAFAEDNLLQAGGGITHHNESVVEDEELSPLAENFIVLTWLRLINPDLPSLVKQRYGTELRTRTLASIKPEISQALASLLDEISNHESAKIMRTAMSGYRPKNFANSRPLSGRKQPIPTRDSKRVVKLCPLCKQAGRNNVGHFLSECSYLPEQDRRFMARARLVDSIIDQDEEEESGALVKAQEYSEYSSRECEGQAADSCTSVSRVQVRQSPYLDTFYRHNPLRITLDSGATGNMIRASTARGMGMLIQSSSQSANQADGRSPLKVLGEVRVKFCRDNKEFFFEGLVVDMLDVEVLAGMPFMERNDISIRPAKRQITLSDGETFTYGSRDGSVLHRVRRACVLRAPCRSTTVYPGEYLELSIPESYADDDATFALEPRYDSPVSRLSKFSQLWPSPSILSSVAGKIRIPNLHDEPIVLKRNEHFCQIHRVFAPPNEPLDNSQDIHVAHMSVHPETVDYSNLIQVDPDNMLSHEIKSKFLALNAKHSEVFDPSIKSYNGFSGPFEAVVNMGPTLPPQRKGRLPQYNRNRLVELQQKFDELESVGVFARPEEVGITVEYLNPSFLVNKPGGGSRLVTAFSDVGRYAKPQPSLMPDVDSTLRLIGQWKYIISTDLTKAFYQIPLAKDSMKYCGVVTPFRGVRVYTPSAMGMPGSETALEELMCRVLGDLLQEGVVAKLADDLYCGANSVLDLLHNWSRVLDAMQKCQLRLSATKTVICPKSTTILGWIWRSGTIEASPHRIATLATCARPSKVGGLRSFIGAYKVLARVIPRCSSVLAPLDDIVAGQQSQSDIVWSDEQCSAFSNAQSALSSNKSITLPNASDQLWIVTDGSVKQYGIGATMYVSRDQGLHVAGFFSAKLRGRQMTWIPCELEALSISAAVKHFSPYIIQSHRNTCVLTDSKPCVQAFEKLCRGEFSASPRVSTFLSTVCRYQCSVRHLKGSSNLPSDFASRNPPSCDVQSCQICTFVRHQESSVVMRTSLHEVLHCNAKAPFTNRSTWISIQSECPDLRRVHSHLKQGTRPSKKITNLKDVKRYLNVASVAQDGLLVVKRDVPLTTVKECIIVPRDIIDGLLTALHLQLQHPSTYQLKTIVSRYFYALDLDKCIASVTSACHECAALRPVPHNIVKQSTEDPPDAVGISFAADVMKREKQLILLVRECSTSYTMTSLIEDERRDTLRDALIKLCVEYCPLDGPLAVIRTDAAPGFSSLVGDDILQHHRIAIDLGRVKNPNKNPVAEKAIRELEDEVLRQAPGCRVLTPVSLATATATLNSRIRNRGLSAREMWFQRDQFSNHQIPLSDYDLIAKQHTLRENNHSSSEDSKAPRGKQQPEASLKVGDLVYLYADRNKLHKRCRYLVTSISYPWCYIRKFTENQLRQFSYKVKVSECFKVPQSTLILPQHSPIPNETSDEESEAILSSEPNILPNIPRAISHPFNTVDSHDREWSTPSTPTHMGNSTIPREVPNHPLFMDPPHAPNNRDCELTVPNMTMPYPTASQHSGHSPSATSDAPYPRRSSRIKRPPVHLRDYDTSI